MADAQTKILSGLAYVGMRLLVAALRLMPLDMATSLGARVGRLAGPHINAKRHKMALRNLSVAFPERTPEERMAICLDHWENLGRVMVETTLIDRILADPSRMVVKNQNLLARYRGKLGSAIGVGLHMGNWELSTWPFVAEGTHPAAVYRSLRNPYIDAYLRKQREPLYPGGLFGRVGAGDNSSEDAKTARAMMAYVRQGGRLGLVCDQYYRDGVPVQLFGKWTKAQPIAAIIARRLGVRVWIVRCARVGRSSRFEIELKELRVPRTRDQADDIRVIMESVYRQFEAWIAEAPEQWVWSNRKWPEVRLAPEQVPADVPDHDVVGSLLAPYAGRTVPSETLGLSA